MKRALLGKCAGALAAALVAAAIGSQGAEAKDYILATAKPNQLILMDAAARKVDKVLQVPGPGAPVSFVVSPDGNIAYVMTNRWESISGVDLNTGKEVFRTDFSTPELRVKGMFGLALSGDGKEIFVIQSPVKLLLGEYQVQDVRVAVYDTSAGLQAKPVRTFNVPRRSTLLHMASDDSKLYVVGFDVGIYNPKTGEKIGEHKVYNWDRPNTTPPDVLGVWGQYEQTNIYVNPYFTVLTDKSPDDPAAYKTGMLVLDMNTGKFSLKDFEDTAVIIFSAVVNPKKKNESYGVYTTLSKIDHEAGTVLKRVDLDHTYYGVNVSSDGKELYLGGTMSDVAVYSSDTLEKLGQIKVPNGADQALTSVRIIKR